MTLKTEKKFDIVQILLNCKFETKYIFKIGLENRSTAIIKMMVAKFVGGQIINVNLIKLKIFKNKYKWYRLENCWFKLSKLPQELSHHTRGLVHGWLWMISKCQSWINQFKINFWLHSLIFGLMFGEIIFYTFLFFKLVV